MTEGTGGIAERQAVVDAVNGSFMAADDKDWGACRAFFADEVLIDHDAGGDPERTKADDLMGSWEGLFGRFEATQHALTNHRVEIDGDEARCRSYVHALHYARGADRGANHYTEYGTCDHELVRGERGGWRIRAYRYAMRYSEGNPSIFFGDGH